MGIGSYGWHNPIPGIDLDFDPILADTNPGIGTVAVLVWGRVAEPLFGVHVHKLVRRGP